MVYMVSITSQGQISIPSKLRKQIGLDKHKKAIVTADRDRVIITPVRDFLDLKGSIKTNKKPLSGEEIHELFGDEIAKNFLG